MEKSSKRGKIPQSDWPLIMARYEAGETLASIARTYDCSAPAISYVVSRSRARHSGGEVAAKPSGGPEPQLVKAAPGEAAAAKPPQAAPDSAAPNGRPIGIEVVVPRPQAAAPDHNDRRPEATREANGFLRSSGERHQTPAGAVPRPQTPLPPGQPVPNGSAPQANGDHRRTLHLSLGHAGHGNGGSHPPETHQPERVPAADSHSARPSPVAPQARESAPLGGFSEIRPAAYDPIRPNDAEPAPRKEGGSFIDRELRARVDGDIAAFLAAFDAALQEDTPESRSVLREATDRLLRAGARTRIELERLEARLPLPARGERARSEPAWRQR